MVSWFVFVIYWFSIYIFCVLIVIIKFNFNNIFVIKDMIIFVVIWFVFYVLGVINLMNNIFYICIKFMIDYV